MDTAIRTLGPARHRTPLSVARYMDDSVRVLVDAHGPADNAAPTWEQAGPRAQLFFDPASTRCGILTAGGLSPGLNDVIRSLVLELWHAYGVRDIVGLPFGFDGLRADPAEAPRVLDAARVAPIHGRGGTVLGTARGRHDPGELCDSIERLGLDVLFCIGGDGTLRGAAAVDAELARRELPIAVVGVPKTIDNDVRHCQETFGFQTAVEEATRSVAAAHAEADAHRNGIGLVKLMGRESGFIAASAVLACPEANFCLVPEVPFRVDAPGGLLDAIEQRLAQRGHAVLVVAEGAGAELVAGHESRDESGNVRPADIGSWLAARIREHFAASDRAITLKYLDPSYSVRSRGANAADAILCGHLAKMAVHAAHAGKTGAVIGQAHGMFVHVPLAAATAAPRRLKPDGLLWQSVVATTGQPDLR